MTEHRSAAASLYPHLPSADPQPRSPRQQPRLADAMFPSLVPQPQSQPAPRPVRSKEWIRDWSTVDERFARLVGLRRC
jgi:hypothetical protein